MCRPPPITLPVGGVSGRQVAAGYLRNEIAVEKGAVDHCTYAWWPVELRLLWTKGIRSARDITQT